MIIIIIIIIVIRIVMMLLLLLIPFCIVYKIVFKNTIVDKMYII